MILSDIEIKEKMRHGLISIDPKPEDIQIQPASIDLTLGDEFKKTDASEWATIFKWYDAKASDGTCFLIPGQSVLAHTKERISIGNGIVARVEGRSSCGRHFLNIHSTAGFVDPGFSGEITLEITNHSNRVIKLKPGMRICQVVFEEAYYSTRLYGDPELDSKYQNQKGATEGKSINTRKDK